MVNSFASSFWDEDFNGTEGYDHLVTRLKDGKKLHDAFSDFVKNRAKLEEEYGKNLIKLAQTEAGNEETGTLKTSWESVKKETENIGAIHCELSRKLNELSERNLAFRDKQKQERYKIDEPIRREQKDKKTHYDTMLKAQRFYHQRCKEYDAAKEAFDGKSSYTPKEEEKLKRNMQKSKSSSENADSAYLNSIKALEDLRKKYLLNMEDACIRYQSLEEGRIQFLRNEMWLYTNYGSTQVINIDEQYEKNRLVIEKCNVAKDIQLFISMKHTGTTRPAAIEYVNFYHQSTAPIDYTTNIDTKISSNSSLANTEKSLSHPNLHTNSGSYDNFSTDGKKNNHVGMQGNTASNPNLMIHSNQLNHHKSNQILKMDDHGSANDVHEPVKARAVFAYQAQSSQELSLNPDDIIEVKSFVDETWAIGILDGKVGAFPLTFVDIL